MKLIWKIFLSLFLLLLLCVPAFCNNYRVAIFDYDDRPEDELTVAKYIEQQLKKSGLSFLEINQFQGNENDVTAMSVLSNLDEDKYDLIITITSDAIIPAIHTLIKTSWLFTNVNNPKIFGIKDDNRFGSNHSGVTYYVPVEKQLNFFKELMRGKLKKIGVIFDYSAQSRRAELAEFRSVAESLKIAYEIKLINHKDEISKAVQQLLLNDVDAVILTSRGKVYNNADLVVKACAVKNVPVFSVNKKGVEKGAIAALASDYFVMVDQCLIPMVKDILSNRISPGRMPVRSLENPFIYLNSTQAKKIDMSIPEEILKQAVKIF